MDHVWNSLKQWEDIWLEQLKDEEHTRSRIQATEYSIA